MTVPRQQRGRGESGAFIVLWAVLLVGLMTMVAIVVDLGDARSVRRTDQSVADLASLAAGTNLGSHPQTACQDAFKYVKGNLPDFPTSGVTSPCNVVGSGGAVFPSACTSVTPAAQDFVATGTSPYTITFRFPVDSGDISDSRFSGGTGASDGSRCERFKVTVAKTRTSLFSGIVGQFVRTNQASAVMRAVNGTSTNIPSLWILDPTGCTSLNASGGSDIEVGNASFPGVITVDSDGSDSSCSSTKQTMDASGNGTLLHANPTTGVAPNLGQIELFAMPAGATSCTQSQCDQGDVSSGRVAPQPLPNDARATRAPADYRWNCKTGYPTYHGITLGDCKDAGVVPAYIDTLKTSLGTLPGVPPSTFQRWTTTGHSCSPNGTTIVDGNWWVDCPGGFSLGTNNNVTFRSGNVVFDGPITLNGTGTLTVNSSQAGRSYDTQCQGSFLQVNGQDSNFVDPSNPPSISTTCLLESFGNSSNDTGAAYMFMRGTVATPANLNLGGGTFNLYHTALIQNTGAVKTTGGSPANWSNPTTGPFKGLALWSEQSDVYTLNGNGSLLLSGTYFTPEAFPFKLVGGSGSSLLSAQFITYQLEISGGGTLNLVPNAQNNISEPAKAGVLIR